MANFWKIFIYAVGLIGTEIVGRTNIAPKRRMRTDLYNRNIVPPIQRTRKGKRVPSYFTHKAAWLIPIQLKTKPIANVFLFQLVWNNPIPSQHYSHQSPVIERQLNYVVPKSIHRIFTFFSWNFLFYSHLDLGAMRSFSTINSFFTSYIMFKVHSEAFSSPSQSFLFTFIFKMTAVVVGIASRQIVKKTSTSPSFKCFNGLKQFKDCLHSSILKKWYTVCVVRSTCKAQ